jgi:putative ABC transport system permease protein
MWIWTWLEDAVHDLRHTGRHVRRSPQLTSAVLLTLVAGIGLNAVAFSLFNGLLFRAQVSRDPASFVETYSFVTGDRDRQWHGTPTKGTLEFYEALRARAQTLSAVTASKWNRFTIRDEQVVQLQGKFVSCNYISTHMGPMVLGRGFVDDDCSGAESPSVIVSELAWSKWFHRDPSIVGRTFILDNRSVSVIGVAPDDAAGGPMSPLILVPYTQASREYFRDPPSRHAFVDISGRLAKGKTLEHVNSELNVIAAALDQLHPGRTTKILATNGALIAEPRNARGMRPRLVLVLGTTLILLMMVCTNVTTLLLARAAERRHEMAVRLSLGATRSRLLRQLLTESVVLALAAGTLSLALAYYLPRPIAQRLAGGVVNVTASFTVDLRVFAYTWGLAVLAGCGAGLTPASESLRTRFAGGFNRISVTGSQTTTFLRGTLIAEQLAISLALLVGMGLVLRSRDHILKPDVGYDPNSVLVVNIDLASLGYSHYSSLAFYDRLLPRLESLPGVGAVGLSSLPPFQGQRLTTVAAGANAAGVSTHVRAVSSSYFDIAGVRLLRGRLFSSPESRFPRSPIAVIISESLARKLSLSAPEVGRRMDLADGTAVQIIGVVSDTSSVRPGERDDGMLYESMGSGSLATASVLMAVTGDPQTLLQVVRSEVRALDPQVFVSPETVAAAISRESERYASVVKLAAIPAGVAIFLAVIGIYGVTAFAAAQRRHEVGVRTALGARPREIVTLFFLSLRWPLLAGLTLGIVLSAAGIHLLRQAKLTADVTLADPWAYGMALLLIGSIAAATFVPALRAARTEPWLALRDD